MKLNEKDDDLELWTRIFDSEKIKDYELFGWLMELMGLRIVLKRLLQEENSDANSNRSNQDVIF
jgi:hypothetical protein